MLIHGWAHDASVFDQQAAALRTRYAVVAYDLRGHGASADTGRGGSIADHTADLVAVIDSVAPRAPVHLIGHDLGGLIALELARTQPARVASLTLVSTLVEMPPNLKDRYRGLVAQAQASPDSYRDWSGRLLPVWLDEAFLSARPDIIGRFDVMFDRHDPGSVAGTLGHIIDHRVTAEDIAGIDAPALVLYGERDYVPQVGGSEQLLGTLRDVTRLRIPKSSHEPQLENPAAVNAAIARHLRSL